MKTAMQELLDMLQVQNPLRNQMLQKEKQQIIDACQCGFYCGNDIANKIKPQFRTSKDYYNNTYKTI